MNTLAVNPTDQAPPHNLETEQAALASVLQSQDALASAIVEIRPTDFYAGKHQKIFEAIRALKERGDPVDLIAVTDELRVTGKLDEVGGPAYVTNLLGTTGTPNNYNFYFRLLRRDADKRKLIVVGHDLIRRSVNGELPEEIAREAIEQLNPPASGNPTSFAVVTAQEMCAVPEPEAAQTLLGPILTRGGRTLIGAHTGEGKTTLALQMVKAVVTAAGFLDWQGPGGRALVLDAEQGTRSVKRQLREAGLDDSNAVDYLRLPDGLSLDKNPAEVTALEKVFAAGIYDLVLTDPLYKLHTGDSNAEREAVDLMRIFDRWRETYGFALLMATHTRKPPPIGARFTMHEFFGSGAYLRGAEVILGLQYVRPGASRLYFFKDRDGDLPVGTRWALLFSRGEGFSKDPDNGKKPSSTDRVFALLASDPDLTNAQLEELTGLKEGTIRSARKRASELDHANALLDEGS